MLLRCANLETRMSKSAKPAVSRTVTLGPVILDKQTLRNKQDRQESLARYDCTVTLSTTSSGVTAQGFPGLLYL
jgi:hypothetical protein